MGLIVAIISLGSCATTMTPIQVYTALPTLTESQFLTTEQAKEKTQSGECKCLVKGRDYAAPQGLTVNGDLKYAAIGIDEWVLLDSGNAYVLKGFHWKSVGDQGGAQLFVEFDTMFCNEKD